MLQFVLARLIRDASQECQNIHIHHLDMSLAVLLLKMAMIQAS